MRLQDIEFPGCFLPAGQGTSGDLLAKLRKALQGVSADAGELLEGGYAIELAEKDLPFAGYFIRATDNHRINARCESQRPRSENREVAAMLTQLMRQRPSPR